MTMQRTGGQTSKSRVVGSGNTTLNWMGSSGGGTAVAFLQSVRDSAPKLVGQGSSIIHTIDSKFPDEIVTSNALGAGTLTLTLVEVYDEFIWEQLLPTASGAFASNGNSYDSLEVQNRQHAMSSDLTANMIVKDASGNVKHFRNYTGCVITAVGEDESVSIGDMNTTKEVTIQYTRCQIIKQGA